VLFLPAPAGAGVREVVLALVLSTVLNSGETLAVVLASRAILILSDLSCAAIAVLTRPQRGWMSHWG
jgi:glycosyltransferase 2 family protein